MSNASLRYFVNVSIHIIERTVNFSPAEFYLTEFMFSDFVEKRDGVGHRFFSRHRVLLELRLMMQPCRSTVCKRNVRLPINLFIFYSNDVVAV